MNIYTVNIIFKENRRKPNRDVSFSISKLISIYRVEGNKIFLKQTQKAAEGPGPVCRLCWGRVGTWHEEQKQLASRKQRPEAAGDGGGVEKKHGVSFSPRGL